MIIASGIIGGAVAEVTPLDERAYTGGVSSVITFSGVNFGTDTGSRFIVVGVAHNPLTASMTIGGVAATQYRNAGTGLDAQISFYVAAPSGTSGDVVLTLGYNLTNIPIKVYAVSYAGSDVPVDWDITGVTTGTPSVSVSVEDRGCVIGFSYSGFAGTLAGVTNDLTGGAPGSNHSKSGSDEITADATLAVTYSTSGYLGAISFK